MCRFIALGVPARMRAHAEHVLGRKGGFVLAAVSNASVRAQFPPSDALLWVTDGHCSCELQPSAPEGEAENAPVRGSSRRRVDSGAGNRREPAKSDAPDGRARRLGLLGRFQTALVALVQTSGRVRVLVHEFDGLVEEDVVGPCARVSLAVEGYARGDGVLAHDAVIELSAGFGGEDPESRRYGTSR